MRCLDMVEAVNHPDRLKYPLRRAGKRGENRWERITWDEAYDEIVEQLGNTQQKPEDLGITMGDKGYAIIKDASGNLVRIPSAEKTEQCLEIVSRFFTAIQMDGLSIADAVDNIIEAINDKQNPELVVHFGYGKEYVNKDGAAARSIEPKKFLAAGAATDEKPAATEEEETAEEIDEFEQA